MIGSSVGNNSLRCWIWDQFGDKTRGAKTSEAEKINAVVFTIQKEQSIPVVRDWENTFNCQQKLRQEQQTHEFDSISVQLNVYLVSIMKRTKSAWEEEPETFAAHIEAGHRDTTIYFEYYLQRSKGRRSVAETALEISSPSFHSDCGFPM